MRDVRIVTDRITAACKGYGFVTFEDDVNVEHLVGRKTIKMNGTKLRVRKAIRRNASQFDHISPSKKWFMLPTNFVQPQSVQPGQTGQPQPNCSTFMTPPNTPPSIEQLSLYENPDSLRAITSANRFLYASSETIDSFQPMLYAANPNNGPMTRSRTNSSPAIRVTPPSIIIPEDEPAFFFPQPQQPIQLQQQPQVNMSRARTYSTPITMQDYEVLRQQHDLQFHHHQQQAPPQTLLVPANQAPPKFLPPVGPTQAYNNQQPQQLQQVKTPVSNQQYLMPVYHHQQPPQNGLVSSSPGKNVMYCVPQPQSIPRYPNNAGAAMIYKSA